MTPKEFVNAHALREVALARVGSTLSAIETPPGHPRRELVEANASQQGTRRTRIRRDYLCASNMLAIAIVLAVCSGCGGRNAGSSETADAAAAGTGDPAVAPSYLENPAHTNAIDDPYLPYPLHRLWAVDLGPQAVVSYPLIVGSFVYVIVTQKDTADSTLLNLAANTGGAIWQAPALGAGNPAYDVAGGGRVFAVTRGGLAQAFDYTGKVVWTKQLPGSGYLVPPVAQGGVLYLDDSSGQLSAVDEASGNVLWTQGAPAMAALSTTPTVSDSAVFLSYSAHGQIFAAAYDRATGAPLWSHSVSESCMPGAFDVGPTPAWFDGDLYTSLPCIAGYGLVLNAATGMQAGMFGAWFPPAFHDGRVFSASPDQLSAVDLKTGATVWSATMAQGFASAPLVVGGEVYVVGGSTLMGFDEATGASNWSDNIGSFAGSETTGAFVSLSAADDVLVVPAGTKLIAYGPAH